MEVHALFRVPYPLFDLVILEQRFFRLGLLET